METKTQAELIEELTVAKARVQQLEASIAEHQQTIADLQAKLSHSQVVPTADAPVRQQVDERVRRRTAELEKINQDLRLSETRFRALVEQSPWSVQILSPNGLTLQVNQAWERLWGVKLDEIPDYNLLEDQQLVDKGIMPFIKRAFAGEIIEMPTFLYDPDETVPQLSRNKDSGRWTRALMYPVKDDAGIIREVVIIHEDITRQKLAEDALRRSEFRFRRLFESNIIGIVVSDFKGSIFEANDAFLNLIGYSRTELEQGQIRWTQLTPPEFTARDEQAIAQCRRQGFCTPYEKAFINKNSQVVPIWIGFAWVDESEEQVICFILDLTERKQVEAERNIREEQFRAVFQDTINGIAMVDVDGRIFAANPAFHRMLGYPDDELKGKNFADITYPDDLSNSQEKFFQLINGDIDHYQNEKRYICKNGDVIWGRMSVSVVRDRYHRIEFSIALVDNITVSKELEEERAQLLAREQAARQQAEEASRLKDEFLAMISHELRTPLTSMLGWTRLLRSGRLETEMVPKALETIERNVNVQAQLIQDLLDISRITTGKLHLQLRSLDPINLVNAAVDSIRPAAEAKAIRIHVDLDITCGPISGDIDRLQQVLWNLLSNAVKFTPQQGQIEVNLMRQQQQIAISITDNGQGIKPEFLPYIFERFTQADSSISRNYGGLGIGLSIVKSITELHGGTVQAESQGPKQGARFTIMLPALKRDPESASGGWRRPQLANLMPQNFTDLTGLKILVVDDEPDTCEMLRLILSQCGATVQTANSVSAALAIFDQWQPQVLISDISMPGENGYDLISKVRRRDAAQGGNIPAIALTAFARIEDRIKALSAGFQMHVPKPVEPDELLTILSGLTTLFQK